MFLLLPVHTSGTDIELGTHASIKNIVSELKKHTHMLLDLI